jgi:hypothetical protein
MERLKNGIYATAMNEHILNLYEDMEDEQMAEYMLGDWLMRGVPDGNELEDNINDFGDKEDFEELLEEYENFCKYYKVCPNFSKEVEEIKKNIVEMLDNPYYNMV